MMQKRIGSKTLFTGSRKCILFACKAIITVLDVRKHIFCPGIIWFLLNHWTT
jgi:hypothetical protein